MLRNPPKNARNAVSLPAVRVPVISGVDQLRDELATVDLGFAERRLNKPIELVPFAERIVLHIRQHQALLSIRSSRTAMLNRVRSYGLLLSHPRLS